jgi:sterile alpha motif and leucine zipper-containing kinase AZK
MILELISCGDLYELVNNPKQEVQWNLRMKIALDIAKAMNFLHTCDPPIVHCDLKTPNVMVRFLSCRGSQARGAEMRAEERDDEC